MVSVKSFASGLLRFTPGVECRTGKRKCMGFYVVNPII